MARIKKNDQVIVVAGKDKGKIGKVTRVLPQANRVFVEKINMVKRHMKPTQKNPQGGVMDKEASIHVSNVMLLDPKSGNRSRVGYRFLKDEKKVRYTKKGNEVL